MNAAARPSGVRRHFARFRLGGTWCFRATRLPVATLFEHLDQGSTIDEFLEWFPSVSREQVHNVLAFARSSLEQPAAVA
jgi:uncharacterized protein (DUF433 family)